MLVNPIGNFENVCALLPHHAAREAGLLVNTQFTLATHTSPMIGDTNLE